MEKYPFIVIIPTSNILPILLLLLLPSVFSTDAKRFNLLDFGAHPDGKTDSSQAFLDVWDKACDSVTYNTIYVPKGRYLVSRALVFSGTECKSRAIAIRIDGTVVAPADYRVFKEEDDTWFSFEYVDGVTISGGTFDGLGAGLWACKESAGKSNCPGGISTLRFTNSQNIVVSRMISMNSQLYHIVVNGCKHVKLQGLTILAPDESPNTDGIHVQLSSDVTINQTKIGTGDDCVSIGAGTTDLWIEGVTCGPGHGISIGSLAKDLDEPGVRNVTCKKIKFLGSQYGVRIKSWGRESNGFVQNVLYQHITMVNVYSPVLIDQNYCPSDADCPGKESGVKITNVTYEDIHGSSTSEVAVKFDCSSTNPCTNIKLKDVKLTYQKKLAVSSCANVDGTVNGLVEPVSCFGST